MSRDQIIQFLKTKQLSPNLANEMISEFSKDLGKSDSEISEILKHSQNPQMMTMAVNNAIPHFMEKYTICSVIDSRTGQILLYY